jgi:hypothetical protein
MAVHSPFLAGLSPEQRQELEDRLWERQTHSCFICDDTIDLDLHRSALEIDHVVPLAENGQDAENNFALVHEFCNRSKSALDLWVARVLARFARIEKEANREYEQKGEIDRGANLGHVLRAHKGAQHQLRILIEDSTARFSIPGDGTMPVTKLPLYTDCLSGMRYCFAFLPISYLHHDSRINPRPIGVNLRGLIEECSRNCLWTRN